MKFKDATFSRKNDMQKMPYGFIADADNPLMGVPDPKIVDLIETAFDYLESGFSTRKVAAWISEKYGKKVSHQGIQDIFKRYRPDAPILKKQKKQARKIKPKTGPEKALAKQKRKRADLKRLMSMQEKKLAAWEDRSKPKSASDGLDFNVAEEKIKDKEVVFSPNPGPQTNFLAASDREVLFGGAAGGGKSYALLADPMRYFGNKNFAGILLRRTNDELRELVWKSQEMYPKAYPGAKWGEKKSQWVFPSGAKMWFTFLERDQDVLRYQGQAFSWIGWDELTQHSTPFGYNYMRSRLRTTDKELPIFIRATTNPGGPGHGWVRDMFIKPAPAGEKFIATDIETGKPMLYPEGHDRAGEPLFNRRFIPSKLKDNPYLAEDGQYEANLLGLPENQRRQLLDGDWSVADGAAFSEWRNDKHVCKPFDIPDDWRRFRSCDYGYSSFSAVHWFAIDPSYETLYVYRELYVSKHTGKDLAHAVMEAERGETMQYGMLDSSCWHNRGQIGPSIAEEMIQAGCRWRPSDRTSGARVAGKNMMHQRLKVDEETDLPGIVFFDTCRQIISDLPVIPSCPKGTDDIDQRYASDHTYDSVRYGVMSRPRAASPFDFGMGTTKPAYRPADMVMGY